MRPHRPLRTSSSFLRILSAWLFLFLSKIAILSVIDFAFGDEVSFGGPLHGVVAFIFVVVVILAAEELIIRFYRALS